ncbi:MAG: TIGR02281 family clan AA aspartic protease [Rhodobacteraceae bacterium]|nr:TIGR02281 family clan AA aspartic protease [Paracoccaceae bacterium]
MSGDDLGHLAYLVLLGAAIGGYLMAERRQALGETLRMALAWSFIFLGVIAGAGLWSDVRQTVLPRQMVFSEGLRVETPRAFDGHYYLTLQVNGTPLDFVVDTGASDIVLKRSDAQKLGVDTDALVFSGSASTANGRVNTARVRVPQITLGNVTDLNVPVMITTGEMDMSLLGMSYLQRFDRIEISGGRLILER